MKVGMKSGGNRMITVKRLCPVKIQFFKLVFDADRMFRLLLMRSGSVRD